MHKKECSSLVRFAAALAVIAGCLSAAPPAQADATADTQSLAAQVKQLQDEVQQLKQQNAAKSGGLKREDAGNRTLDQSNASSPSSGVQGMESLTPAQQKELMQQLGDLKAKRAEEMKFMQELEKGL